MMVILVSMMLLLQLITQLDNLCIDSSRERGSALLPLLHEYKPHEMHNPGYEPSKSAHLPLIIDVTFIITNQRTQVDNTELVKNKTTTSGKELKPSSSSKVVKRSVVHCLSGEIEPLPRRWTFFDGHSWVARLIHLPTLKLDLSLLDSLDLNPVYRFKICTSTTYELKIVVALPNWGLGTFECCV